MPLFKITNKVDGDADPLYADASTDKDAISIVHAVIGPIPNTLLRVEEVDELPAGEELLNDQL